MATSDDRALERAREIADVKLRLFRSIKRMKDLGVAPPCGRPDLYMNLSELQKSFALQCAVAQRTLPLERYIDLLDVLEESLPRVPPLDVDATLGPPEEDVANSETVACGVCFDELNPSDPVFPLDCSHRFHPQCLRDWVRKGGKGTCPLDRQPLTKKRKLS